MLLVDKCDGEIVRCARFVIRLFYSVLLECPSALDAADSVYGKFDAKRGSRGIPADFVFFRGADCGGGRYIAAVISRKL